MANQSISIRRLAFTDYRRQTLNLILFGLLVVLWGWVLYTSLDTSTTFVIARLMAIGGLLVTIVALLLEQISFRASCVIFLSSATIGCALAFQFFDLSVFLYCFALIGLMACAIESPVIAILVGLLASGYMLSLGLTPVDFTAIGFLWMTLLTGLAAFGILYRALANNNDYLEWAILRMDEAREHRAELVRLNIELNKAQMELRTVNQQLQHARNLAEEGRRLKAQFAANVSHELRTPINLIVGFSEMITLAPESYGAMLPAAYRADVHAIYRNAKHLQSLINDVLDVSRIEAGQMTIVKEPINPGQVLEEAANLARDLIERKNLDFQVDIPPDIPILWLDRTRIRQVLLNLLSNATRFTDEGCITLKAIYADCILRIMVSDTGIGIPESEFKMVFREFHQIEGSLARRQGGSGLGLTLSKQFVELHGGRIWVESEGKPGKGSTFYVELPEQPIGPAPTETEGAEAEPPCILNLLPDTALLDRYLEKYRVITAAAQDDLTPLYDRLHPIAVIAENVEQAGAFAPVPVITCNLRHGTAVNPYNGQDNHLLNVATPDRLAEVLKPLAPHRILIIDDERDIVQMLKRMVRIVSPKYEILSAFDGESGITLLRQRHPDVLILDYDMPLLNGLPLLTYMKRFPELSDLPIILISNKGGQDVISPLVEAHLSLARGEGFQPSTVSRAIEAMLDSLIPISVA
jgi:signal transduction histidine kinase/CheY-like chemotaxis protein